MKADNAVRAEKIEFNAMHTNAWLPSEQEAILHPLDRFRPRAEVAGRPIAPLLERKKGRAYSHGLFAHCFESALPILHILDERVLIGFRVVWHRFTFVI